MNISILTEGFQHTGYGHLTRCQSIYQAFEKIGYQPKMIVNGDDNAKVILKNENTNFFNWLEDCELLFGMIENADIAIIDSYLADLNFYKTFATIVKKPVYIDDNNRLDYPNGIIVNGCINAENIVYPKNGNKYLLGIQYQPMRKAFWEIYTRKMSSKVQSILITMGGTDARNLTPKLLQLLEKDFPTIEKNVVIGKGFSNLSEIHHFEGKNTKLHYYLDDNRMRELMLNSDIAVSAAGQTLYELVSTQIPTIAIGIIDNQLNNINGWLQLGIIKFAGWWTDQDLTQKLKDDLDELFMAKNRKLMIENHCKFCIPNSTINLVENIIDHQ